MVLLGTVVTTILITNNSRSYEKKSATIAQAAAIAIVSPDILTTDLGTKQIIRWTTSNYPWPTVSINLIKKTNDNPRTFELVRVISKNAKNDGEGVWIPSKGDVGKDIYIEIGCVESANACQPAYSSSGIAVIDSGKYENTAAVSQALESEENN